MYFPIKIIFFLRSRTLCDLHFNAVLVQPEVEGSYRDQGDSCCVMAWQSEDEGKQAPPASSRTSSGEKSKDDAVAGYWLSADLCGLSGDVEESTDRRLKDDFSGIYRRYLDVAYQKWKRIAADRWSSAMSIIFSRCHLRSRQFFFFFLRVWKPIFFERGGDNVYFQFFCRWRPSCIEGTLVFHTRFGDYKRDIKKNKILRNSQKPSQSAIFLRMILLEAIKL